MQYYIDCIEREEIQSLTFNFKSENKSFLSNIFQEEQFFYKKRNQVIIKKTEPLKKFLEKYTLTEKTSPLFYGYPLFIDTNGKVSPLFFVELFFEEKEGEVIFTKESVIPEFNHYVLSETGFTLEEIEKIRAITEEQDDFSLKLSGVFDTLELDSVDLGPTLSSERLNIPTKSQIINKAILYVGKRTGITRGLLDELQKLKSPNSGDLEDTGLKFLLDSARIEEDEKIPKKETLEILSLNNSQEEALENALTKPFTVVTGPPGTGKSQVVLNILANSVWNDQRVLFASKNNRAVDVVIDKLKSTISKNLIVRMGNNINRRNTNLELRQLLSNKDSLRQTQNQEELIRNLASVDKRIGNIKEQINRLHELNEGLDLVQKEIDSLMKNLPDELCNIWLEHGYVGSLDKFELEKEIASLKTSKGLIHRLIRRLFSKHYETKQYKTFRKYYDPLPDDIKNFLDANIRLTSEDIIRALGWILTFKEIHLVSLKAKGLRDELFKLPNVPDLDLKIKRLKKEKQILSLQVLENDWFSKIKGAGLDEENDVLRYLDASEKLEGYIENYSLWKELISIQQKSMQSILDYLPVWVVTNLSAKNSLPMKAGLFDLLVIDEASQCDIASALPLFYRAKRVIVIGDPKQLKHISTLKASQDKKIASDNGVEQLFVDHSYSGNSLYELSERLYKSKKKQPILLNTHYRSHADIISFSNESFYDKKLDIKTDKDSLLPDKQIAKRVEWIDIRGKTIPSKSPYNPDEIEEIINLLKRYRNSELRTASFGVVTLFREQMDRIVDRISKTEVLKDLDITVGTAHRFQGDEKDIIIFSPVVARGIETRTLNWIHTTIQLLNVAITRARSALIIVGDKKYCFDSGGILRDLVSHIENLKRPTNTYDSEVEKILHDALDKEGIEVIPQYWVTVKNKKKYRLDFALLTSEGNWDIEIDGNKAHSGKVDYDELRDTHLRLEGWKVRRFQANEVQNNLSGALEEIKRIC